MGRRSWSIIYQLLVRSCQRGVNHKDGFRDLSSASSDISVVGYKAGVNILATVYFNYFTCGLLSLYGDGNWVNLFICFPHTAIGQFYLIDREIWIKLRKSQWRWMVTKVHSRLRCRHKKNVECQRIWHQCYKVSLRFCPDMINSL